MLYYKMKKNIIFSLTVLFVSMFSTQLVFAQDIQQEPEPPRIPEPTPTPDPIMPPKTEPISPPFSKETESEKIQRLTEENNMLKEENHNLETKIIELNKLLTNLHQIIMEQIKVIMNLVSKLKMATLDNTFYSVDNI